MAEQRAVVEIELGIQGEHPPLARDDQGIDLGERGIALTKRAIQPVHEAPRLALRRFGYADLARDVVRLSIGEALARIERHPVNLLRAARRDLFDLHAALGARDERDSLRSAIDD